MFNDLFLHDVEWTSSHLSYDWDPYDTDTGPYLSRGLLHIFDIGHTNNVARHHELLPLEYGLPPLITRFLHDSIDEFSRPSLKLDGSKSLDPFYIDPDAGPEIVWSKTRGSKWDTADVKDWDYVPERACGYVFWDHKRMQGTGWFDFEWEYQCRGYFVKTEEKIELNDRNSEEIENSRKLRKELARYGFDGYWEEGGVLDQYLDEIDQARFDEELRLRTCFTNGREKPPESWTHRDASACWVFKRCPACCRQFGTEKILGKSLVDKCVKRLLAVHREEKGRA